MIIKLQKKQGFLVGLLITILLAVFSQFFAGFIPMHLISAGVFSMLIGMCLNPIVKKIDGLSSAFSFVSKKILKASIVLMGITLSFTQVLNVGKYSLIVMMFTLTAAFGFGNLFGRLFKMNWKLSNLISAGTGICGGSAIAAISPTIDADDSDIAYAISATFIFDIAMVILFPILGRAAGMTDMGFGLWAGTAVNDTSSVVAAGYAFSDAAGQYATIVKLTRTLSIVPVVLIFAFINQRIKATEAVGGSVESKKVKIHSIFPWFIIFFLVMSAIRTIADFIAANNTLSFVTADNISTASGIVSAISKFAMVMALGAIGLKTDFRKIAKSGIKPMLHGFIISAIVVVVSFMVQMMLGQM